MVAHIAIFKTPVLLWVLFVYIFAERGFTKKKRKEKSPENVV